MRSYKPIILASSIFAAGLLTPGVALAKRPGVLEEKPIVERKLELRKLRFQVTPFVGTTLAQPFVHVGLAGAHLQFDFSDALGLRVGGAFGAIPIQTELTKNMLLVLPEGVDEKGNTGKEDSVLRTEKDRKNLAPLKHDFEHGLTRLKFAGSADLVFTPIAGKIGLFSSVFTEYDLYVFGGIGFTGWQKQNSGTKSTTDRLGLTPNTSSSGIDANACGSPDPNVECVLHPVFPDEATRIGASFGAGVHIFLSDWVAINAEVHDIFNKHNDTGFSSNRETVPVVDEKDAGRRHNVMFNLGVTFYLPPKAKRRTAQP